MSGRVGPQVLEQRGNAGERWEGVAATATFVDLGSGCTGIVEPADHHIVQRSVEFIDALDCGLDEFSCRRLTAREELGLSGGIEPAS